MRFLGNISLDLWAIGVLISITLPRFCYLVTSGFGGRYWVLLPPSLRCLCCSGLFCCIQEGEPPLWIWPSALVGAVWAVQPRFLLSHLGCLVWSAAVQWATLRPQVLLLFH